MPFRQIHPIIAIIFFKIEIIMWDECMWRGWLVLIVGVGLSDV
jgi:hypothetical protein